MNKTEFLETLRAQLAGQMQAGTAETHIRYYRDYIDAQVRSGHSEEEVLAGLGDPRLIAKTLLDTDPQAGQEVYENGGTYYDSGDYGESGYGGSGYNSSGYDGPQPGHVKRRSYKLDLTTWYGKAIVIAIAVLVIVILLFIIGTVLPVIIIAALIIALISWLRRRL